MRSGFSSDDSDSMDESENGYLEEDIQSLIKESNKKIQADTKQQKTGKGVFTRDYSVDKPTPKLAQKEVPVYAFKKAPQVSQNQAIDRMRPSTSAKPARGIDKTKAYELFDESEDERAYKPTPLVASKPQKEPSQASQSTGPSKRPSTSTTVQSTNTGATSASRPTSALTPSKQPPEQASPSKAATSSKGRGPIADLQTSQARDTSTDTIKKKTTPKKCKLKHKIAMACYHERSEIPLVRHFVELGEWKRVLKFEDADFTFVNNERKLDWDVALKTMVGCC